MKNWLCSLVGHRPSANVWFRDERWRPVCERCDRQLNGSAGDGVGHHAPAHGGKAGACPG